MRTKTETKPTSNPSAKPQSRTSAFEIGKNYFIRTVTYHLVGRVTAIVGRDLLLADASWIADSGRFMQAIKNGTLNEVEPVGDAIVNLDSYTDAFPWHHPLPKDQK